MIKIDFLWDWIECDRKFVSWWIFLKSNLFSTAWNLLGWGGAQIPLYILKNCYLEWIIIFDIEKWNVVYEHPLQKIISNKLIFLERDKKINWKPRKRHQIIIFYWKKNLESLTSDSNFGPHSIWNSTAHTKIILKWRGSWRYAN